MIHPLVTLRRGALQFREAHARTGTPTARLLAQLAQMRFVNGTARAEYFKYRLWRPGLSTVERLSYTVQRERRQSESATNWNGHTRVARSKTSFAVQLQAGGMAMPEVLARITPGATAGLRDVADLQAFLQREGGHPMVLKPDHGMQGDGVVVMVEADRSGVTTLAGERIGAADLWSRLSRSGSGDWLMERWVQPHPLVGAWRPGATPTVRILTLVTGGQAVVHAASIKVPVGAGGTDNLAQGNLAAAVDLQSGVVGQATDGSGIPWHRTHPESAAPIAGITIPNWPAFLSVALHGAGLLLPHRAIGWDVAVGVSGPVVIEANTKWCEKLIQLPAGHGLTRGPFIRLLHEAGAGHLLARRRLVSREWREFEDRALEGGD